MLMCFTKVNAQDTSTLPLGDTFTFNPDTSYVLDSLASDSVFYTVQKKNGNTLLDSIANESNLRRIFKPYLFIQNKYVEKIKFKRDLPNAKEIVKRPAVPAPWKFWVVIFIVLYISLIRIFNPINFKTFLLSVFNLKLSERIWEEQRSAFTFIFLQMFAIYIFIASLFITFQLELKAIDFIDNRLWQFAAISGLLTLIYFGKFLMHAILGYLLKMNKLAIGFVSNTITVNNFIALVIFPLIIFMNYHYDELWSVVLTQSIVSLFFISVGYRIIRIFMLSASFFSFPVIYLILYLCSLEILPWLIIIKYLNAAPL